jgi:hypothetical protein
MSNSLLSLGGFAFVGLESPEKVLVKAKQRLTVHLLGSGQSTTDYLGEDCETVSFRGIFSGPTAANRIRSLDHLRTLGTPLVLAWNASTLLVMIKQLELDYSSARWITYKLSCYVVRSVSAGMEDPTDLMSASPDAQVSDMLSLLGNTSIVPTPGQADAIRTLAALEFDTPPPDALLQARDLVGAIDDQLAISTGTSQNANLPDQMSTMEKASLMAVLVSQCGQQAALILGRNRVVSVITGAEGVSQP